MSVGQIVAGRAARHKRDTGLARMARILVVEDEQDLQKVLEYNLADHEPIAAMRGRVHRAREGATADAVLLDLMLPMYRGRKFVRR